MAKKPAPAKKKTRTISAPSTDSSAAEKWLHGLNEAEFRDKILAHLFLKMQKSGAVAWAKNIHGRNDKGIDFLVKHQSDFGTRIIGVQAKSVKIVRSSDSSDTSAIRIASECEAAVRHEFDLDVGKGKVDNIELWCSNHITEDAEKEFAAPGRQINIRIKRASEIAALLEKFCPEYLHKIPDLALTMFIKARQEPPCKSLRLMGAALNPKLHFIEPTLSKHPLASPRAFRKIKNKIEQVGSNVKLNDIVGGGQHLIIVGSDLCGKTYLLERLDYLIAANNEIPVFFPSDSLGSDKLLSIEKSVAGKLNFLTANEIHSSTIRFTLLIDDFEKISIENQAYLLRLDPTRFRVLGTSSRAIENGAANIYITGINHESIPHFLRSIDRGLGEKSFTDRAHSFINRTLASSGLSSNPFTVAIMLNECQGGAGRFSTPTMGRLIERFVELQLGSHNESGNKVDFETKREFLIKLAGKRNGTFTVTSLRKIIGKFIDQRTHPHTIDDFYEDLKSSGVFEIVDHSVRWSHPVIAEFFWVKNLLGKDRVLPVVSILQKSQNQALASIVGSQMRNATDLINTLLEGLKGINIPTPEAIIDSVVGSNFLKQWAEGGDEEELLLQIENQDAFPLVPGEVPPSPEPATETPHASAKGKVSGEDGKLTEAEKSKLNQHIDDIMHVIRDAKLFLGPNIAALVINARDTKTDTKVAAVNALLNSNDQFGGVLEKLVRILTSGDKRQAFLHGWTRIYFQMQLADQMLGDPFLVNVFKKLLKKAGRNTIQTLTLLDLLIACGEDDYDEVLSRLRTINRVDVTFALYLRMLALYYYRYHKARERANLRAFLMNMRKIHSGMTLPLPS